MRPLTAAILLTLAPAIGLSAAEPASDVPSLAEILAEDFEVVDLSGETVPLSHLVGSRRPVVIEFWATWCGPCRKTLPRLVDLKRQYGADLVILGLTVEDPQDDRDEVREYAVEHEINFPIAFAPDELFQFMNDRPDIAVPKLFVFDDEGRLAQYIPRYSPFTPGKIRRAVRRVTQQHQE